MYRLGWTPKYFLNKVLKYLEFTNPVCMETSVTGIPCCSRAAACLRRIIRMKSCGVCPVRAFSRSWKRVRHMAMFRQSRSMSNSKSLMLSFTIWVAFPQRHCPHYWAWQIVQAFLWWSCLSKGYVAGQSVYSIAVGVCDSLFVPEFWLSVYLCRKVWLCSHRLLSAILLWWMSWRSWR